MNNNTIKNSIIDHYATKYQHRTGTSIEDYKGLLCDEMDTLTHVINHQSKEHPLYKSNIRKAKAVIAEMERVGIKVISA